MVNNSRRGPPQAPALVDCQQPGSGGEDAVEYHADTDTYRVSFDDSSDSVCTAVLSTVATIAETDPIALQPLHSAVDPDALETLVQSDADGPSRGDVHVSFTLDEYEVTVHSYGIIAVRPLEAVTP